MGMRAMLHLLVVLGSLLPATAWPFDALRTASGRVVHVPRTPWPVYLQAAPMDKLSVVKVEKALLAAIGAWNGVPGTRIELAYGGLVVEPPHLGLYVWRDGAFVWAGSDGTARTDMEWTDDGELRVATIALNGVDFQWVTGNSATGTDKRQPADLQSVLTHQLGHALGIGHSHDPNATMYFWGTGRAGRTLTQDDQRALQFVYPAQDVTASATCEPCRSDADCAGTGRCLIWPDGFAYCAASCTSHGDCPVGTSCGAYASGIACLPNDGHCNADRATAAEGEACASDFACTRSDLCMPIAAGQGFCTSACAADWQCGTGASCTSGGYCVQHGLGQDGSTCRVPGDCASGDCQASVLRTGVCGSDCEGQCAGGEVCGDDGTCRPSCTQAPCPDGLSCQADGVCRGPMAIGWPCASGYDCASGSCVTMIGAKFDRFCSKSCELASDCPEGTGCTSTKLGKICLPGAQLAAGSPCTLDAACGPGRACDRSAPKAGYGVCAQGCDPFGDSTECAGGRCQWHGSGTAAAGICVADMGGGGLGAACSPTAPCRADLSCADIDGTATCLQACAPSTPACGAGLSCLAVDGSNVRGVCHDGGSAARLVEPAAVAGTLNLDARVVNLPQVVPVAQFQPAASKPQAAPGCSAHPGQPGSPLVVLAGALLASGITGARRRRVQRVSPTALSSEPQSRRARAPVSA